MAVASLTDTQGMVALAAGAVAVLAVLWCVALSVKLRRIRGAQKAVLGAEGKDDLVTHAARMQEAFEALHDYVGDFAGGLDGRLGEVERQLLHTISNRSLVRYDAYNELSGRQSMSIALLDQTRSGIVLSCIHHRDQARVYAKQLHAGEGEGELSPEEAEAVRIAGTAPVAEDDVPAGSG